MIPGFVYVVLSVLFSIVFGCLLALCYVFFLRVSILYGKIMKFNLKITVAFLLVIYVLIRNQFCIYVSSTIQFYHDNFIKPFLS